MIFSLQRANYVGNVQGKNIIMHLKLIIIFLVKIRPQGICFLTPVSIFHRDRCIAKVKYASSYKIYLFRIQFKTIKCKYFAEI